MKIKIVIFFLYITVNSVSQNNVYFLEDTANSYTKENIYLGNFQKIDDQILEPYSDKVYWFKIPSNETKSKYIFRILYERIKEAEVYQNNKKVKKLKNERYLSYQFSREADVFIKVNPILHDYIPFELCEKEKALVKEKNQLILNGFYYGFAFLVIIYNLFYFLLFKDDTFLYYTLFLGSMSFGVFIMDGMLDFYGFSTSAINFCMILNYIFLAFFTSKFANSYLFLEKHYPKLKKIAYPIGISIVIIGLIYLVQDKYPYLLLLLINVFVFSLMIMYWFTGLLLFNKNIYTKILVFAYIIILISGIDFFVLKFLGISFINITSVNIKIGAFIEMILLSVAVLYRMMVLKQEHEFMKNEIVQYSKIYNSLNALDSKEDLIKSLSIREREIFKLVTEGYTNKQIAGELNISVNTVKFHIKNIYEKLKIKSRKEAYNWNLN